MKFAFAYLGVPQEIYDAVLKEGNFIAGSGTTPHFIHPGAEQLGYRPHEATKALEAFFPYVQLEKDRETGDTGLAAICIRRGASDRVVTDVLFPFVLTVFVDWKLDATDHKALKQSKNALVRKLCELGPIVRRAIEAIKRDLEEQRQRTPWLLPVQNFKSKHLHAALRNLQDTATTTEPTVEIISKLSDEFRHHHPMQKIQDGRHQDRRYFVDDSGLRFKPPGYDLHGFHKPSTGHNIVCEISSRRRLGAPFHP
jgi:hypothetical protein